MGGVWLPMRSGTSCCAEAEPAVTAASARSRAAPAATRRCAPKRVPAPRVMLPSLVRSSLTRLPADFKNRPDLRRDRAGFDPLGGPDILNGHADRFVISDLRCILTTGTLAGDDLRYLRDLALSQDAFAERNLQVAGMLKAISPAVDDAFGRARDCFAVDLAGIRAIGADGGDESSAAQRRTVEHRLGGRRSADNDVGVRHSYIALGCERDVDRNASSRAPRPANERFRAYGRSRHHPHALERKDVAKRHELVAGNAPGTKQHQRRA